MFLQRMCISVLCLKAGLADQLAANTLEGSGLIFFDREARQCFFVMTIDGHVISNVGRSLRY